MLNEFIIIMLILCFCYMFFESHIENYCFKKKRIVLTEKLAIIIPEPTITQKYVFKHDI